MTDRPIPFHVADISEEEIEAVVTTLRSGWLTTGPKVAEFEADFAGFVGARHAIAVNSATAALHLACEAIGLKAGDEVVVPTMTFTASAEVVAYFGAKPALADCSSAALTMEAADVEAVLTSKTKAIMPVHMAGHACDMDPLLELAASRGLHVIEDAAHSLPAKYKGRRIGSISEFTAFSFYATKTLTTGEGGMLTTDDSAHASRVKLMSLHGMSRQAWNRYSATGSWRYDVLEAGFKYNMTDMAASLGVVQLRRQEALLANRKRVAMLYNAAFANQPGIKLPANHPDVEHSWHIYMIRLDLPRLRQNRDVIIEQLREAGVGTSVHFIPLHMHSYYRREYGYVPDQFPLATAAFDELISLPIYPGLTNADAARVCDIVMQTIRKNLR